MKQIMLAAMLAACGGDAVTPDAPHADAVGPDATASPNVVHGTVGGATFDARDAIFKNVTASGFDFPGVSTVIEMTTFAGDCALQTSSTGTPNGHILVLVLGQTDGNGGSTPASTAGAYMITSGTLPANARLAEAYFELDDATCHRASHGMAVSGIVTLTAAGDPARGTFDLTFPNSEHVTGSFAAPSCAGLDPNRTPLGGC